ncbi:unnamed protein product [Bursaphelenchus xylophilus]|uniref:(pine wood nematode) hypothetical protein n=1 Tax=Bursaphelenchus xylophilus TaxID=6326 RepID=A0A1I7SQC0_BURXY|nr:unnamed protein product [Bursaphelenchus xylophilus]CAG9109710.1 unnamed protein product [Bursaphelenchus xylophilus]
MTYALSLMLVVVLVMEMCHSVPEQDFYRSENSNAMPLYMERRFSKFRGEPVRFGKRAYREPIRFGKRAYMPNNQISNGGYGQNAEN